MAKEKVEAPNVFGGFEALSKSLLGNGPTQGKDDDIPYIDPEDLKDRDDEVDDEEEKEVAEEEEIVEEKPAKKEKPAKVEEVDDDEEEEDEPVEPSEDTDDLEVEVTTFLKTRLEEELGIDIDPEEKLESIKDVVDYLKTVTEENSKPKYHSEEIKKLDEFVKNGGNIDKYFKEIYGASEIDLDKIDLTRENNQRLVIKELLKEKGYKPDLINRTIERYEKAETLEDEANDAVELLKEYKAVKQEKLLEDQKKQSIENAKQQQIFFDNVQNNIKELDNVRGIKISSKEKSELLDYIFKPDSEGLTKYQRDYMSDIKNLIESAYFTKKGDSLINEAKKKGSSDAYKEFHQKLKANKGKRSKNSGSLESGSDSDLILSSLSKSLLNKV